MPPTSLLDGASLFLDFDGTLVDIVDDPGAVAADDDLRELLALLHSRFEGRIAIISGRSLVQLDAMLGPVSQLIAVSGSHGSEHRWHGVSAQPHRPASLDFAAARLRGFAEERSGVLVEEKSYGVALHWRMQPAAEQAATRLVESLASELDLHVQAGKMMAELRIPGGGKDVAVRRLMARPPMSSGRPVFVGDDLTDECAFEMVRSVGGNGVLVGPSRATAASYHLPDPTAVRAWLRETLE